MQQSIKEWVRYREVTGRPTFSFPEALSAVPHLSEQLVSNELYLLSKQGRIASVYKGYYTIIPAHYALKRVVPPSYYIDQLMNFLGKPYYISLLSAAELLGAAHQRPQRFSVTTTTPAVRTSPRKNHLIVWTFRRAIPQKLLCEKNSETGTIQYSNPELTAADLVQYEHAVGGLSVAATVIEELAEQLDFSRNMEALLETASLSALQRLGYILDEILEQHRCADSLFSTLKHIRLNYTPLSSGQTMDGCSRDKHWKIIVNQQIETDDI